MADQLIVQPPVAGFCLPRSRRPVLRDDDRSGRWLGAAKREDGIHA